MVEFSDSTLWTKVAATTRDGHSRAAAAACRSLMLDRAHTSDTHTSGTLPAQAALLSSGSDQGNPLIVITSVRAILEGRVGYL